MPVNTPSYTPPLSGELAIAKKEIARLENELREAQLELARVTGNTIPNKNWTPYHHSFCKFEAEPNAIFFLNCFADTNQDPFTVRVSTVEDGATAANKLMGIKSMGIKFEAKPLSCFMFLDDAYRTVKKISKAEVYTTIRDPMLLTCLEAILPAMDSFERSAQSYKAKQANLIAKDWGCR